MQNIAPLALDAIQIKDPLFGHYIDKLRTEIIPYQWEVLNDRVENAAKSGCLDNFRIAAGLMDGEHHGQIFQDSDLAKWLEAVAYSLNTHPDAELEAKADECIELLAKAQQPDGYLNTYYTLKEPGKRWSNLMEGHELYCAGHFIEAAVAYYASTGKKQFLEIMCRYADLIDRTFGPEEGKLHGYPGHEEIELALVKLWHVTGEERYLRLADYFISERGKKPLYFLEELKKRNGQLHFGLPLIAEPQYSQSAETPMNQTSVHGHSVRATYLLCAMADLAAARGDEKLRQACRTLFEDITQSKMFITGGIGSAANGEQFSTPYDLPNESCYCETCASIGLALFSLRMCRMERDARYADVMEQALYNTVLAGINQDGNRFFYVNPLSVVPEICEGNADLTHVKDERQQWFDVACCPTNIARTLGSLGQYLFGLNERELFVYLYLSCTAKLPQGTIAIETRYPAEGSISLHLELKEALELNLRLPWHSPLKVISCNQKPVEAVMEKGFARLSLEAGHWDVELKLDVQPRFVYAHEKVRADAGRVALMMGPVVYCLEEKDNGISLANRGVYNGVKPIPAENPVDGSMPALRLSGWRASREGALYSFTPPEKLGTELTAIPYYCWNNRGKGEMQVWMLQE